MQEVATIMKLFIACMLFILPVFAAVALEDPVKVDGGLISGASIGDDRAVTVYKGIPYAAPPVGALRWKPPQPVRDWDGVRECTEFGSSCPHVPYPPGSLWTGPEWDDPADQSEDCLYLNVWTSAKTPDDRLPVMVWIHGGSLAHESGSVPAYGGANLASRGVVVVTINYRLGPFGFLAHPELTEESEHGSSGNYGVLDQIAALEWVQRNIAAFCGDPDRVTIFGESAGSWSVCFLVASPLAKGLFHRAIGQSGGGFGPMAYLKEDRYGLVAAEKVGMAFAEMMGTEESPLTIAELRAKSAEEVLVSFGKARHSRSAPNVDGWVFPDEIHTIFEQGRQNRVPVIVGSNADEGTSLFGAFAPSTVEAFEQHVTRHYGDLADEFRAVYPVDETGDVRRAFMASARDEWFTWQMRTWARLTATVDEKAYLYYFTRVPPIEKSATYGAYHGAEIVYVMGNFHLASFKPEAVDKQLAATMSGYWLNFARSGDPNGDGLPEWPAYDIENEKYMELGDTVHAGTALLKEECDFLDKYFTVKRSDQ